MDHERTTSDRADPYWGGAASAALAGAADTGLLEALVSDKASAAGWANRLDLDPLATRRVLDVLAFAGWVDRSGDEYTASAALQAADDGPGGVQGQVRVWSSVGRVLRSGRPLPAYGSVTERDRTYAEVVPALGRLHQAPARELAERMETASRILDVGAGSAVWSLEMVRHAPRSRVIALDLPEVVSSAVARAERLDLAARLETLPGDFHAIELPDAAFDRVLVANVLRIEKPPVAAGLIGRLARTLAPGGDLVIVDVLEERGVLLDRRQAAYALHLTLRTASGGPHAREDVERWCEAAGLAVDRIFRLESGPVQESVLVAASA